jgi:uncharacterized protein (PEP-CTERM system associated)
MANEWTFVPFIAATETYSDNITLATEGLQQSDWVTQFVPGISIARNGARLRFNATYEPEFIYYANKTRDSDVLQRGNFVGTAELARQLLFVEAGARIDQYDILLQGPLANNNVNLTGNRATTRTSYVSPYAKHDFGSAARGEAKFTHSVWKSDAQSSLPDNEANRVDLRLESGPAYKRFTWDMVYGRESIQYVTRQETLTEASIANARRLITSTVALLALVGHERYDSGTAGNELASSRWSAGLEWTPTTRTRLAASAGKRFDDDAYSFELRHRARLATWSADYTEDVTTSRSQFFVPDTASTAGALDQLFLGQYPDPAARQKAVQEFIARTGLPASLNAPVNFFSDQLFLRKKWQASVGLQGARNSLVANFFRETRTALFGSTLLPASGDFAASNAIRSTGGSLAWNWRVTARSAFNAGAGYTRNEFLQSDRIDDLAYLRLGLSRQFQPKLSGSLYYRRQERQSTVAGSDYVENAAIATLRLTF